MLLTVYGLGGLPGALIAANPDEQTVNVLAWPILNLSLLLVAITGGVMFLRFLIRLGRPGEAVEPSL